MKAPIAVDLETTGLSQRLDKITSVATCDSQMQRHFYHYAKDDLTPLRNILADDMQPKVFHNPKFDLAFLQKDGFIIKGPIHDTLTMAHLVNELTSTGLKPLAELYLNDQGQEAQLYSKWVKKHGYLNVPDEIIIPYNLKDAEMTLKLYWLLHKEIEYDYQSLYDMEIELINPIMEMESNGMLIDTEYCTTMQQKIFFLYRQLEAQIYAHTGEINLRSTKQLASALYDKLQLPCEAYTDRGGRSTDIDALLTLSGKHPVIELLLKYRRMVKIEEFFDKLLASQEDEIIYTSLWPSGTITGRFSSSKPNLQQMPKEAEDIKDYSVRKAFIVRPGYINTYFDYDGMEMVAFAHISQEHKLIQAIANGQDIHQMTADGINAQQLAQVCQKPEYFQKARFIGKTFNFAIIYGMSATGLATEFQIPRQTAKEYLEAYYANYLSVKSMFESARQQLFERGYIQSYSGRRFRPAYNDAYKGVNYLIQGTCADVMKQAMIAIHNFLREYHPNCNMLMTIHDEFIIEIPKNNGREWQIIRDIKHVIEGANQTQIPFTCTAKYSDTDWANKKELPK